MPCEKGSILLHRFRQQNVLDQPWLNGEMKWPGIRQFLMILKCPFFSRMALAPPSYCFVAFPPHTKDGLVVIGKNSARPRDEVQEIVYFAAATHDPGCKVEVNSFILYLICGFDKGHVCQMWHIDSRGQYCKMACCSVLFSPVLTFGSIYLIVKIYTSIENRNLKISLLSLAHKYLGVIQVTSHFPFVFIMTILFFLYFQSRHCQSNSSWVKLQFIQQRL